MSKNLSQIDDLPFFIFGVIVFYIVFGFSFSVFSLFYFVFGPCSIFVLVLDYSFFFACEFGVLFRVDWLVLFCGLNVLLWIGMLFFVALMGIAGQ